MITHSFKAILGILLILGGSLLVQAAWRRVFPGVAADEDVLAGRLGCHACPRQLSCEPLRCDTGDSEPSPLTPDR